MKRVVGGSNGMTKAGGNPPIGKRDRKIDLERGKRDAPSGNRTRGISMATRYFTTKPMAHFMHASLHCTLTHQTFKPISNITLPHKLYTQKHTTAKIKLYYPSIHTPLQTISKPLQMISYCLGLFTSILFY